MFFSSATPASFPPLFLLLLDLFFYRVDPQTEARAFLGVTGYYRQHIPDYAKIAQPWTDVIGKTDKDAEKRPLEVTEAMEASFETLKASLVSAPILGFPYFRGPKAGRFILDTDFGWPAGHEDRQGHHLRPRDHRGSRQESGR